MPNTVNTEVIKVEGVNPKPFLKGGKTISAGGLLVDSERKIWVNVAPGLDMKVFQKDGSYEVEREILENGKAGNIIKVVGFDDAVTPEGVSKTSNGDHKIVLDRDTRITLMNVANVAATLANGDIAKFDAAFEHVELKYRKKGVL